MSRVDAVRRRIGPRGAVAAAVVPAAVGGVALLRGYQFPATPGAAAPVVAAGVALAALGAVGWWCLSTGRAVAAGVAAAAAVGALAAAAAAPSLATARVGRDAVVAGPRPLARFAGVAPWAVAAVVAVGAAETVAPWSGSGRDEERPPRLAALGVAVAVGVVAGGLAVAPVVLVGGGADGLLPLAGGGTAVAAAVVAYLFLRPRLVAPALLAAGAAGVGAAAVVAGGDPAGPATAWPLWLGAGLVAGGADAVGRRLRSRWQ